MHSNTNQGAQSKRLCFMLHLIGRLKCDLGDDAPFGEFLALALGWAVVFVGHVVEALSCVVIVLCYQKSVLMPCVDGGVVYVEFSGHFTFGK